MNTYRRLVQFSVMLALLAGCASVGTEKCLEPGDLPLLAGKWRGHVHSVAVGTRQVELTIHPDGSFVSFHAADRAEGRMRIVDGKLEIREQIGASATSSTAKLYERNGKRLLVRVAGQGAARRGQGRPG